MSDLRNVVVPQEVKEAWETVASFLNSLPELSFSLSPWYEDGKEIIGQKKYTIHAGGNNHRDFQLPANSEWESSEKS